MFGPGSESLWHIHQAVRALRAGGLVLHATEGVWGLACDPDNPHSVARLLTIKDRPIGKGLILIGDDANRFEPELGRLDRRTRARIEASWPGPVTWVVPRQRFPAWVSGDHQTVAIRVTGHLQARALCAAFDGVLVSTSANLTGRAPARSQLHARRFATLALCAARDYLLPGEVLGSGVPSEIRTADGRTLRPAPPAGPATGDAAAQTRLGRGRG